MQKRARTLLKRIIWIGSGMAVLTATFIVFDGKTDDAVDAADLGIVFGSKVESNGEPSMGLQARLDRGVVAYGDGEVKKLFVSGGVGKTGFNEAEVMRDYLINQGVPKGAIVVDGKGNNTSLTARNAAEYAEKEGLQSAVAISEYFHIARCKLLCRRAGIGEVYGYGADSVELGDVYSTAREVVACWAYWLHLKA